MCADKFNHQFSQDEEQERKQAEEAGKLPQPEPVSSISAESSLVSSNETQIPEKLDSSSIVSEEIQISHQEQRLEQEKTDENLSLIEEACQPITPSLAEEEKSIITPAEVPLAVVKKQLIFLFILLFIGYAYFFQGGQGNYSPQFALTRSIIERHRLDVGGYSTGADIIVHNGKLYSNKAPGNALLALVPFYIFWELLLWLKIKLWLAEHLVVYFTTIFTTSLLSVLVAIWLYLIVLKITNHSFSALLASLGYGLATIAFPFATMFFSHQAATFCCFTAFFILFRIKDKTDSRGLIPLLVIAGFLSGYAVVTEYPTFLITVLLTLYAFWTLKRKVNIVYFLAGGLVAAAILITFNILAYGDPFFIPYQAYTRPDSRSFAGHRQGFLGVTYPKLDVLWKITFHPQRGLFYINPILLAFIPGLLFCWFYKKYRRELALILGIIIAYFSFNASYGDCITYWGGGASIGPRHIIPMLPFAMIPAGIFFHKVRLLYPILFFPSFIFMLLVTAINPVMEYKYYNPVTDYMIPYFASGELAILQFGTFNNKFILPNSVAFNLGLLAGIEGSLSLLPLAAIWTVLLWFILSDLVKKQFLKNHTRYIWITITGVIFILLGFTPVVHQQYKTRYVIDPNVSGLMGYYFPNDKWEGNPAFIQRDQQINFVWDAKSHPLTPPYSIEWRGKIIIPEDGTYFFQTESDDGSLLYIDNKLIVDNSGHHAPILKEGKTYLIAGEHQILLKYANYAYGGVIKLSWTRPGRNSEIIPTKYLLSR